MRASSLHPDDSDSRPSASAAVSQWLDALADGSSSQDEFLRRVQSLEESDPDLPWEVLSLLDQYLRRERISHDVYVSLKARVQQRYMGFGGESLTTVPPTPQGLAPTVQTTVPPTPQGLAPTVQTTMPPTVAGRDDALQVGDVLRGRYRIVDKLRKDGATALFEAIDHFKMDVPDVSHRVVIEIFGGDSQRDPGLLHRICALQSLSHPGIERIFEVDEDRGALMTVKESLRGVSLQQLLEQGGARLTVLAAQTITRNVASALAYAHSKNVFHGNVRAGNIIVTDVGEVRLLGFESEAREVPPNPKGDRLAFAVFAYELFSGLRAKPVGGGQTRLREPHGITREQWRMMRDTLAGREGNTGNLLTAFAGGNNPGPVVLPLGSERMQPRRFGLSEWLASGLVAVILIVAGYFVVTRGTSTFPPAAAKPATAIVPAPPEAVSKPGDVAAPPVAAATVPAESAPPVTKIPVVPAPVRSRAIIDLPSATQSTAGDEPVAKIWVRRKGGLTGAVTFLWWTESGSAQVDQDFREITPRTATIEDGASGVELLVPLVPNHLRQRPRTFYVKIDEPGSGATLGDRTLIQVSIVPPEYEKAP
jgi:hypothetical protein